MIIKVFGIYLNHNSDFKEKFDIIKQIKTDKQIYIMCEIQDFIQLRKYIKNIKHIEDSKRFFNFCDEIYIIDRTRIWFSFCIFYGSYC